MKKFLLFIILTLPFTARAQSTNLALRVQEERVSGGVTNTITTNFRYDYGTAKDALKVDGYVFGWFQAKANGYTNDLGAWIKQDMGDRAKNYRDAKSALDNAIILQRIQYLLSNLDILGTNFTTLSNISNLAP